MDQSWITRILEPLNLNLKDDKMYEVRRHGNKYKVFEIRTKKYIASCINQSDANELVDKLTTSGFQGETPDFFTKSGIVRYRQKKVDAY